MWTSVPDWRLAARSDSQKVTLVWPGAHLAPPRFFHPPPPSTQYRAENPHFVGVPMAERSVLATRHRPRLKSAARGDDRAGATTYVACANGTLIGSWDER